MKSPLRALRAGVAALIVSTWGNPTLAADTPLSIQVYNSPEHHMGLGVNSTLIMGERDAVLVDAQFTLSNAHRLVAEILESGKNLTHVYITHLHPDHFMGLPVIKQAFPGARVVSLPGIAGDVNGAADFKIAYWGNQVLGVNGAKTAITVESLSEPVLLLEGKRLEIVGPFQGDAANSSAVWIPSTRTLIASDMLFNNSHVWMADGKTPELRQAWLDALDQLEALNPAVVVPGHSPSNQYLGPEAIAFTRDYIHTFLSEMSNSADSGELIAEMMKKYPDAGLGFALEFSAKILRDDWVWEGEWPPSLRETKVVR